MGGCQSCSDILGKSTGTMLKRYSDSSCYVELRFFELLFKFSNQNKIKLPIPSTYTFCIENSFPVAFKCDENDIIQVGKISESQIQEDFKTFQKQNGPFPAAIAKLEIPNSHEEVCLPLMTYIEAMQVWNYLKKKRVQCVFQQFIVSKWNCAQVLITHYKNQSQKEKDQ